MQQDNIQWELCSLPNPVGKGPSLSFIIGAGGRRLTINAAAMRAAGFDSGTGVVMERSGSMFRVRRAATGETPFQSLTSTNGSAVFGVGGGILADAGFQPGTIAASATEGGIVFDASEVVPFKKRPPVRESVVSRPATETVSPPPPTNGEAKPWKVKPHPRVALMIVKSLVGRVEYPAICRDLDVTNEDILAVRQMIGDVKIGALRSAPEVEREEYYGKALERWMVRFGAAQLVQP